MPPPILYIDTGVIPASPGLTNPTFDLPAYATPFEFPAAQRQLSTIDLLPAVVPFELSAPQRQLSNIDLIGGQLPPVAPTQPVISNVSPVVGEPISDTTILSFDVTDPDAFRLIMLIADFPNIEVREVIHDGNSFSVNYSGSGNARVAIPNGFRYSVLRRGGWPVSPRIIPFAIDITGEENV